MSNLRSQRPFQQRRRRGQRGKDGNPPSLGYEKIFEDEHMIVVSKAAGILSVPFEGARSLSVLQLVNRYLESKKQHATVVHRIDRFTSGLLVFAKHKKMRDLLIKQFIAHSPKREYMALVRGQLKPSSGELTHYMRLSKNGFKQVVVKKHDDDATVAKLSFKTISTNGSISLLRIRLVTGLKNQIRVQFSEIGHPIVGDRHYVEAEAEEPIIDHQALHACTLGFIHPASRKYIEFQVDPPADFRAVMRQNDLTIEPRPR